MRGCLDWTERSAHLAGRLGSAVLTETGACQVATLGITPTDRAVPTRRFGAYAS